jgi:predicted anti-sigma-YlaC factor YlaD
MEYEMTCKELVELVTDYLEGTLPDEVRLRLENHLLECDGCTNYLDQMRQTIQLTGQLSEASLTAQQCDDLLKLFRDWKKV